MPAAWTPTSWHSKPIVQVPDYPDAKALADVESKLATFPPLVFAGETDKLKASLANVAHGKAFLLQGGDCAESFEEHTANNIRDFFRVFLQMAAVLTFAGGLPVVKVGRIAGQFAKPRSSPMEKIGGVELPSYRGDIINDIAFTPESRIPDPGRQLQAYRQSAATLNFLRAFIQGGYASLENIESWELDFVRGKPIEARYDALAHDIKRTLEIMAALGIRAENTPVLRDVDFYTSHEALLLGFEQALTRRDEARGTGRYYATSAHFIWIGDRTRQPDHAHIEFMCGIANPIGLKCGPSLSEDGLMELIDILNPKDEAGRLTLICRFGADKVDKHLPKLVERVKKEGRTVVWSCDPMHGNTQSAAGGYKTRPFEKVVGEIESFFAIHQGLGTHAGGIHLEMTGKDVTECTGGAIAITEARLADQYDTRCDPRLNAQQALEVAFLMAERMKLERADTSAMARAAAGGS